MRSLLQGRLGEHVQVSLQQMLRNNAVVSESIMICEEGSNISPSIRLDTFYRDYRSGRPVADLADRIQECYLDEKKKIPGFFDVSQFTVKEKALGHIVRRVINRERNAGILREVPHRDYLDLSVIYYYMVDLQEWYSGEKVIFKNDPRASVICRWDGDPKQGTDHIQTPGACAIMVKNEHMKIWQMSEEELFRRSADNMQDRIPPLFLPVCEMMQQLTGKPLPEDTQSDSLLYVLSNKEKCFGAAWITDSQVLRMMYETLQEEYYVLPSSIHECMIVPACAQSREQDLLDMVREINSALVDPEEILSDNIYHYDSQSGALDVLT